MSARGSRHGLHLRRLGACLAVSLVSGCASPPLQLYTLGAPGIASVPAPLDRTAPLIQVSRVTLPDYLDTQDILTRRDNVLEISHNGRWASRLSLGITDLLVARLSQRQPGALISGQPQIDTPSYRLLINISRLDISTSGEAALDADWTIVARDQAVPPRRERAHFSAHGKIATDEDVVRLAQTLLIQLADTIDITQLR